MHRSHFRDRPIDRVPAAGISLTADPPGHMATRWGRASATRAWVSVPVISSSRGSIGRLSATAGLRAIGAISDSRAKLLEMVPSGLTTYRRYEGRALDLAV